MHRRVGGEESRAGAPIRADLSAISEAIPRCKTGGVGGEGAEDGCFGFGVGVVIPKIRKIAEVADASHYPRVTSFDIV